MTEARIATKTIPNMQVELQRTLLSAAEHVLIEISLGLFRKGVSLRQQEEAIKIAK
jgi:hypothetical protein